MSWIQKILASLLITSMVDTLWLSFLDMRKPSSLDALALGFPRYLYPLSTELASGLSYFSHVSDRARRSIRFWLFKIIFSWVILFCSP